MKYRKKKNSETGNQFLINIFRESGGVNFIDFLDNYFKDKENLEEYKQDIPITEKDKVSLSKKDTSEEKKVIFAKKPERLRGKKGQLF